MRIIKEYSLGIIDKNYDIDNFNNNLILRI